MLSMSKIRLLMSFIIPSALRKGANTTQPVDVCSEGEQDTCMIPGIESRLR